MRNLLTLFCLFSVLTGFLPAQSPYADWLQVRNLLQDQPESAGRLFITRDMARAPWGPFFLTGYSGRADTTRLLRQYDATGLPGATFNVTAPKGDTLDFVWGTSMAFSPTDLFLSGLFEGSMKLSEDYTFVSQNNNRDAFLAAFSPGGGVRWAVSLGDNFEEKLPIIGITDDNRLALALRTADTLFRPIEIRTFDRLGNKLDSVKVFHAPEIEDIRFDKQGNLYLAGKLRFASTIGGNTVQAKGTEDFYLAKYGANGSLRWLMHAGTEGEAGTTAIEIADDGKVFFASYFGLGGPAGDTLRLADSTYLSTRSNDLIVGCVDSSGRLLWSDHIYRSLGGFSNGMQINDIAVFDQDLYLAGSFMDGGTLIGDTLLRTNKFDPVVLKYSTTGDFHWATRAGTENSDQGLRITPIGPKRLFVAGVLNDVKDSLNAIFGDINFPVQNKFEPFLAILKDNYIPPVTRIDTEMNGSWLMYPNPTRDRFTLRWDNIAQQVDAIRLFDLQGRVLQKRGSIPGTRGEVSFDLSSFPPGLYVVQVQAGKYRWARQVQKLP